MQKIKKHLPLAVIIGILFVTGVVFANVFISQNKVSVSTALGDEGNNDGGNGGGDNGGDNQGDNNGGDNQTSKTTAKTVRTVSSQNQNQQENGNSQGNTAQDNNVDEQDGSNNDNSIDTNQAGVNEQNGDNNNQQADNNQNGVNEPDGNNNDTAKEYKNAVAQFVHELQNVDEQNGDNNNIGQQVSEVAKAQNDSQIKVENAINDVNERGKVAKFLIGPKYGSIAEIQTAIIENQARIKVLADLASQATDPVVKKVLQDQIKLLQKQDAKLQTFIAQSESGISLFGWLAKMFS